MTMVFKNKVRGCLYYRNYHLILRRIFFLRCPLVYSYTFNIFLSPFSSLLFLDPILPPRSYIFPTPCPPFFPSSTFSPRYPICPSFSSSPYVSFFLLPLIFPFFSLFPNFPFSPFSLNFIYLSSLHYFPPFSLFP